MSGIVGLPFAFSANRLTGFHHVLQIAAGAFSIVFGLWYAFNTGASAFLLAGWTT
jgi:uncharacterized membrane protein HdeD (DUF308 family)